MPAIRPHATLNLTRLGAPAMLIAALLALPGCSGKGGNQAPPPPEVSVTKTVAQPVTVYEEYVAQTEAVDTVEIRARVSGVLERQAFEDGSRVKKGELLFVIDQQPYIAEIGRASCRERV